MAFIMSSTLHKIINGRDLLSWKVAFETFTEEKQFRMSLVGYYDQIMDFITPLTSWRGIY